MTNRLKAASAALLAFAWLAPGLQAPAFASDGTANDPDKPSRYSRSVEGRSAASTADLSGLESAPVAEFNALRSDGPRVFPGRSSPGSTTGKNIDLIANAGVASNSHETVDFWIYDADTRVFYDFDGDGYFYGLTVYFDADVSDGSADVFAELYLSRNGGPWNLYHTTRVFGIFGASAEDEYEVITEFDSGYPTGDYDVLVELYDADTGDFLTDLGPVDDIELSYLPLEDAGYDTPPVYGGYYGGGGSLGPTLLLLLLLLVAWRQRHHERAQIATDPALRAPAQK